MRAPRRALVSLVWLLTLALAPLRAGAQEKVSSAGEPTPSSPAATVPQTAPAQVAREFVADPPAVRTAFLALLQEEAFPLTPDSSGMEIVTEFTYFAANRFGHNVAMPPPKVSPTFPFYQMNNMVTGKARLRASIESNGTGSRVRVEALLLSPAVNRLTYESAEIPRDSNGTIEKHFLDKLEERLSAAQPQTAPSH